MKRPLAGTSIKIALAGLFATGLIMCSTNTTDAKSQPKALVVSIDPDKPSEKFPHFWENLISSQTAIFQSRTNFKKDLKFCKQAFDIRHVQFPYAPSDNPGNYSDLDEICKMLIAEGIHPFINLVFRKDQTPEDCTRLVSELGKHCVEQFNIGETSQWYFTISKSGNYFELYSATAKALKATSAYWRVGGPNGAHSEDPAKFITKCSKNGTPIDFVLSNSRSQRTAEACKTMVKNSAKRNLPIIWNETKSAIWKHSDAPDSERMAPWLAETIKENVGFTDFYSFLKICDEPAKDNGKPFAGGLGLIAQNNIPKSSFYAFKILDLLGDDIIPVEPQSSPVIATTKDGWLTLAIWNHEGKQKKKSKLHRHIEIQIRDADRYAKGTCYTINKNYGCSYRLWRALGAPKCLTKAQVEQLKVDSIPQTEFVSAENLQFSMEPDELRVILFFPKSNRN